MHYSQPQGVHTRNLINLNENDVQKEAKTRQKLSIRFLPKLQI